ncbi:hypothetical protein SAMN05421823_107106 [Catalinimonas alkaloidigena]|uniref:Lipoprotein n=1 Tax=Catalinimonas alkaloidigena TaxID=1075417 RepID=A0A1G9LN31_9BACT|nr:hypothetical protein [Catalinimonas alkaloidigena]SDL63338.1 hypothetical protein SAMN05421823_107106 [Catalinimonas alkaloidigena]
MKHLVWIPVSLLASSLLLGGCQREEVNKVDDDTAEQEIAEENALADQYFEELTSITDEGAKGSIDSYRMVGTPASPPEGSIIAATNCVTLTHQSNEEGGVITIDFGTENCLCKDDRYRRGKIIATYEGTYQTAGTTVTITLDDYYVNDFHVEGTKRVINKGENEAGNLWYEVSVQGTITRPDGRQFSHTSTHQREWLEGNSTQAWGDDVFGITGNASGVSARGIVHTTEIEEAIIIKRACRFPVSGIATFTREGGLVDRSLTIDYGDGACDNEAVVTNTRGQSATIMLR